MFTNPSNVWVEALKDLDGLGHERIRSILREVFVTPLVMFLHEKHPGLLGPFQCLFRRDPDSPYNWVISPYNWVV